MNREQFLEYMDHFNNKRYDDVASYFAPDIIVEYFTSLSDPKAPPRTRGAWSDREAERRFRIWQ